MKTRCWFVAFCILLTGVLIACKGHDPNTLDRPLAEKLIKKHSQIQSMSTVLRLEPKGRSRGIEDLMWVMFPEKECALTNFGCEFFSSISTNEVVLKMPSSELNLVVSGIADAALGVGYKEAHFSWVYGDIPWPAKLCVTDGGKGFAMFRFFDDGWRLEKIEVMYSDRPMQLTPEDERVRGQYFHTTVLPQRARDQTVHDANWGCSYEVDWKKYKDGTLEVYNNKIVFPRSSDGVNTTIDYRNLIDVEIMGGGMGRPGLVFHFSDYYSESQIWDRNMASVRMSKRMANSARKNVMRLLEEWRSAHLCG